MNRSDDNPQETYCLKSLICPPKIKEMVAFEKELWHLVNKLKFRKIKSKFQRQLNKNIRVIKRSNKVLVLVLANKTLNMYKLDTDECKNVTTEAVTSAYKKVPDRTKQQNQIKTQKNYGKQNRINDKNFCFPKITQKLVC